MSSTDPSSTAELDLDELYEFTIALARKAGDNLLRAVMTRTTATESVEKESSVDIVTQADEDAELLIRTEVLKKYPDHKFIGEETYSKGAERSYLVQPTQPTWIVDPLDGTVNFVHGFVMFCVSISFLLHGTPTVGVIYAPFINQLFSARAGCGAYLTSPSISPTPLRLPLTRSPLPPDAPKGCILSCEWGKDRRAAASGNLHKKLTSFKQLSLETSAGGGMVHGVRCLGSAALDLAYLAMGGVDIWLEGGCWEWDVAAGVVLLKEAGGLLTSCNPPEDVDGEIKEAHIGGRLFLGVRGAEGVDGETAREAQERVVREVWRRVVPLDYSRPGVRRELILPIV